MRAYEIVLCGGPFDAARGHGFTIALPPDHRCHGEGLVGLSVFGPSFDVNEGGTPVVPEIRAVLADRSEEPSDPGLRMLWRSRTDRHPRLRLMQDLIRNTYAMILLTAEELQGPPCHPPQLVRNRFNEGLHPPAWLEHGAASAFHRFGWHPEFFDGLGIVPDDRHDFHLGFDLVAREGDPNAGLAPCSECDSEQTGYRPCVVTDAQDGSVANRWCDLETILHLGGTMGRVSSRTPRTSPHYLEFEEYFGGFNFAGGTMWIDFERGACDFNRY